MALAATALSSFVAQGVPYASGIVSNNNTVSFVLNQPAAGVTVLRDGANPVTIDATAQGIKTFDMTGHTTYSIIVTGNTAKAWTQFIPDGGASARNFWFPNSVAINKNPASTNFGKVYVNNGNLAASDATGAGRTTPDGIYVLRADGEAVGGPYDGGLGSAFMTGDAGNYSRFFKINLNPDDDCLYAASFYDDAAYGFNADLSVATRLTDESNLNSTLGTNFQYIESLYVTGSQAAGNRVLYAVNSSYNDSSHRGVTAYNLGANATVAAGDLGSQVLGPGGFSGYYPSDIDRDSSGNWFTSSYRATAGQAPDVKKWDGAAAWPNTTPAWDSAGSHGYVRGIGVNEAGRTVAAGRFASGSGQVYFYDLETGADRGMVDIGNICRDIAFDAAGNMVSVDNSLEYARFWSPGGFSIATTKSDGTFNLYTPDGLAVTALALEAAETGPNPAMLTITRSGSLDASLEVYYTLSGTAVSNLDYTISPTSPFTFPANQETMYITITPIDDAVLEPTETVILTLQPSGTAYFVDSPSSATATITDNDAMFRYWDANGATDGAGTEPNGTWGTDNFWSASADGNVATGAWTDSAIAVFSAGADAWTPFTVTVNGTMTVGSLAFEENRVTLQGGTLNHKNLLPITVAYSDALIKSTITGSAGLTLEGPGSLVLAGANTYTGSTLIKWGTLVVGSDAGVIPDGSAVTIDAGAKLTLDDQALASGAHSETIGSLTGEAGAEANVPATATLTFGADNTDTLWDGNATGDGSLAKIGGGKTTLGASGKLPNTLTIAGGAISFDLIAQLSSANSITLDNGGVLESTSVGVGTAFLTGRPITIGAGGGTMRVANDAAILMVTDVIPGAGTLTSDGPGELRTYTAQHTFAKLIVKSGLYTAGHGISPGYDTSFGAVPAAPTADALTIYGGAAIRKAGGQNVTLDPNRGVLLMGAGTKTIRSYAGDTDVGTFEITGAISGTGPLQVPGPSDYAYGGNIVLKGQNSYSDGTIVQRGGVYVINSFSGSGTGSGTVTVNAAALLGGEGNIGGPVVVSGGSLSPGYTYYTGAVPATQVTKPVAKLALTNGLDLSASGTYAWQLGALSAASPGTDWDQVELTGGNLTLGGSSVLNLGFTGTATAPDGVEAFWQTPKQWKIIPVSGGGSVAGNFSAITGTNGITLGTFSTTADATGITLVWTPGGATPAPVTNMSIASGPGAGQFTISYLGGNGSQFVLLSTNNIASPRASWERVATNTPPGPGSFIITPGPGNKFFYIQSE